MDAIVYDKVGKEAKKIRDVLYGIYPQETITDAAIASFDDGADGMPVQELVADIEPVQDLHGYGHPWPAGGGVNKLDAKEQAAAVVNGITGQVYPNNRLVMSGTATASGDIYAVFNTPLLVPANSKIVVSWYGTDNRDGQLVLYLRSTSDEFVNYITVSPSGHSATFTVTNEQTIKSILFRTFSGSTITSFDCNVEVSFGEVAPATYSPYSNICPISGWTGANVTRTGVNLWGGLQMAEDMNAAYSGNTIDRTAGTVRAYPVTGYWYFQNYKFKNNQRYTLILKRADASSSNDSINICFRYSDETYSVGVFASGASTAVVTSTAGKSVVGIRSIMQGATFAELLYEECGLFEGVLTADDFVPYTGSQISVTFPETIYGGKDDITAGSADSTGYLHTYPVGGGVSYSGTKALSSRFSIPVGVNVIWRGMEISNMFSPDWNVMGHNDNTPPYIFAVYNNSIYFTLPAEINTVEGGKAWLNEHVPQFLLYRAEPQTLSHDPQTLDTLYGANNIWADTGNIKKLTYRADLGKYIDSHITAAVANALNA